MITQNKVCTVKVTCDTGYTHTSMQRGNFEDIQNRYFNSVKYYRQDPNDRDKIDTITSVELVKTEYFLHNTEDDWTVPSWFVPRNS